MKIERAIKNKKQLQYFSLSNIMAIDFVFNSGRSLDCSPTKDKQTAIKKWIYNITELPMFTKTTNFDLKYDDYNDINNNNNKNIC